MVDINQRIKVFAQLGDFFAKFRLGINNEHYLDASFFDRLAHAIARSKVKNPWFTEANVRTALDAWARELTEERLKQWVDRYPHFKEPATPKRIAVIMAGNIPLVGFHDFLSVLLTGNTVLAKLSSDDAEIFPVIKAILVELAPEMEQRIELVERIERPDAVIATGSNNSARYFQAYFGQYPHIIRKNRTSVAILTGEESDKELQKLGEDIFTYFGLGCRNVSKLYLPVNYNLNNIFGAIIDFSEVRNHHKYANNYDYYRAIYMLNKIKFLENGFVIFKEDQSMHTPIAVIHYEYYSEYEQVTSMLKSMQEEIQCIVGKGVGFVPFGQAQHPQLWDYADGVDTIEFLQSL